MPVLRAFQLLAIGSLGGLLGVWAIYPGVVAAIARRKRRGSDEPAPASGELPSVSVVIATREEPDAIKRRVANALGATYPADALEVIVALDPRGATTPETLGTLDPRARVVVGDDPGGKPGALNAGARAARGDVLVLGDTHSRFEPDAVERLARAAMRPETGAVSGRLVIPGQADAGRLVHAYWEMETRLRDDEAAIHSAAGVTGAIYAMRRALWSPIPTGLILDDVWIPMRLALDGKRIGFERDAVAVDVRPPVRSSEFRRKVRTLTGVIQLCAWMPALLVPGRNPIWAQFVVHKLLRLLTPYLLLGVAVGLVGMTVVWLGATRFLLALSLAAVLGALVLLVRAELRRRVRDLVLWGLTLQAAVVVATFNGIRGRWDVWR